MWSLFQFPLTWMCPVSRMSPSLSGFFESERPSPRFLLVETIFGWLFTPTLVSESPYPGGILDASSFIHFFAQGLTVFSSPLPRRFQHFQHPGLKVCAFLNFSPTVLPIVAFEISKHPLFCCMFSLRPSFGGCCNLLSVFFTVSLNQSTTCSPSSFD